MEIRTCHIIKACKNSDYYYPKDCTPLERVKMYMSEECDTPIEHYTDNIIDRIMFEAMCDYVDTCNIPSEFLRIIDSLVFKNKMSRAEQIASAFQLVQVMDSRGYYINGFEGKWE